MNETIGRAALTRVRALLTAGVLGQLIAVAAVPLLTRIYSEAEFGALALLSSVLAIITPIAALRFEVAVPLPESDSEAADVLGLASVIVCLVSVATLVVASVVTMVLPSIDSSRSVEWVVAIFINLLLSGLYVVGITWLIRVEEFTRIAIIGAVQAVAQSGAYIVVGLALPSSLGLFIALTLGNLVGALGVFKGVQAHGHRPNPTLTRHTLGVAWRRYRRFAFVSAPASFMNTVSTELPFLVLAKVMTRATFGVLSIARRLTQAPISLLAQAVGQVFFGASARFRRGNERVVTRTLVALIMAMTAISAVALLLYLFVVPPILAAVFDEGWEQTGRFVQLLSFGFLAQGVAAATTSVVDVAQRQELQLLREGVRLVSTGIAAIVIVRSVDSPQAAVAAFSIVGVANAVVAIVISLIAARDVDAASATDANRDSYPRGV